MKNKKYFLWIQFIGVLITYFRMIPVQASTGPTAQVTACLKAVTQLPEEKYRVLFAGMNLLQSGPGFRSHRGTVALGRVTLHLEDIHSEQMRMRIVVEHDGSLPPSALTDLMVKHLGQDTKFTHQVSHRLERGYTSPHFTSHVEVDSSPLLRHENFRKFKEFISDLFKR